MNKLYYNQKHKTNFSTKINYINKVDNMYHITLNETHFFPGGGGQFCDKGSIDNIEVIDVYEKDNTIYHVLSTKPENEEVECIINKERREDGMHQHLGQHILSGCFYKTYNLNTFGFHMGAKVSTIDIRGSVNPKQLRHIEVIANDVINDNIYIETLLPNKNELNDICIRRDLPDTSDQIRIVKIGDLDSNACCGLHPDKTLELRMIKIIKSEKINGGTRISYLAGQRAISYSLKRDLNLTNTCIHLKTTDDELLNYIKNIESKNDTLNKSINLLNNKISTYIFNNLVQNSISINKIQILSKVFIDEEVSVLSSITNLINKDDNLIGFFVLTNDSSTKLIYSSSKSLKNININDYLKHSLSIYNGKGGGNSHLAQGIINNKYDLEEILNNIIEKFINEIS